MAVIPPQARGIAAATQGVPIHSKRVNELVIVIGRWRDALGAARDGWIVDRLDVDAVPGEQRSLASLHFSGSAPGGEPRQRQLPRQIGSWPTSRSWFTSFVLLSLTASASFCRKRYSKRSSYSGSLRHTGARDAVILQCAGLLGTGTAPSPSGFTVIRTIAKRRT